MLCETRFNEVYKEEYPMKLYDNTLNDTLNSIQWNLQRRKSNAYHTVIDWLNVLGN